MTAISRIFAFQSTPSGGKATGTKGEQGYGGVEFQSTPSGGKATVDQPAVIPGAEGFNPRLPGGRRRAGDTGGARC